MSDALRAGLRANWTQGDFGEVARFAQPAADAFVERLALRPGERVADI
ncbi:SAM-dependent methyltransferase, partial [Endobacter medicaginis]|nr:SAM-dependent methyltransferase [Endobacter medicaginis]